MRIDLLLKYVCLAKSRASAKILCEKGMVTLNSKRAKPSTEVHEGDRISIETPGGTKLVEILSLPAGQVSRKAAPEYYKDLTS
jgi:ribosomal 50S subunit-recycling heat shock protein